MRDGTGYMATILRRPGLPYTAYYDKVPLDVVANSVRHLPDGWVCKDRPDVTDDFMDYARPLIGETAPASVLEAGLQRFARFEMRMADKKLPGYVPVRHRE